MSDPTAAPAVNNDPAAGVTPFYLDKGLYVALLTPVAAVLNQKFGIALDPIVVVGLMLPIVGYILGHKWKSGTIAAAQVAGAAAAKAPAGALNS